MSTKIAGDINSLAQSRIKAIETHYNGYRFRSRLEARWAVFFDAIGIEYEYESEGYDLGSSGHYLPDFYLPGLACFVEIKPTLPSREEWGKCQALHVMTGKPVFISTRSPIEVPGESKWPHSNNMWAIPSTVAGKTKEVSWGDNYFDDPYKWSQCPECGAVGITFFGELQDLPCECFNGRSLCECLFGNRSSDLKAAFRKARSARFEHGESP